MALNSVNRFNGLVCGGVKPLKRLFSLVAACDHRAEAAVLMRSSAQVFIGLFLQSGNDSKPHFAIPLHVADASCPSELFNCGADLLAWRFAPQVHYDSSIQNSQYRLLTNNSTVGSVAATRRPSVRSYSGANRNNTWSLCQGASEITNPIDVTRFYVLNLITTS
jgi:hypothetical protein